MKYIIPGMTIILIVFLVMPVFAMPTDTSATDPEIIMQRAYNTDQKRLYCKIYMHDQLIAQEVWDNRNHLIERRGSIPDGKVKVYAKNGRLLLDYDYLFNLRQGFETHYYPSGGIQRVISYDDDHQNGVDRMYLSSENVHLECDIIEGQRNGDFTLCFSNGSRSVQGRLKNGKVDGVIRTYSQAGQLESESVFLNGQLDGYEKIVDVSGNVVCRSSYKKGELVRMEVLDPLTQRINLYVPPPDNAMLPTPPPVPSTEKKMFLFKGSTSKYTNTRRK